MFCLLFLATQAGAQEDSSSSCKAAALDIRPEFFNGPGDYFTVALNLRKISEEACIPDLPLYPPQFTATEAQPVKPFRVCDACEDHLPNGQVRWEPPLLLSPGEIGHQTYRWKTAPENTAVACQRLSALGGPALLIVAPTLLVRVCSDIEVSRYNPGIFPGLPGKSGENPREAGDPEALVLSTSKRTYYQGEEFSLHVSLAFPRGGSPTDEECPMLFLWKRSADGTTRLDEAHPAGFRGCKSLLFGAKRDSDWETGFELYSGSGGAWSGIGTQSFELLEIVGSTEGAGIQFARSNELKVRIEDPSLIPRKWGPKINGVRVDLTLDKDTYQVGEDVPLHIATENLDAPAPIYATDPTWDPPAVGVEVRNSGGQLLAQSERSWPAAWTGHGRGPVLYPPGKLVPIELSLKSMGWLPNHPGTYTVIVTWVTSTGPSAVEQSGLGSQGDARPYATVQAAAVLRIVDGLSPTSH